MNKLSIKDLPDSTFEGKRVLVRVDWNVPLNPDGTVASDNRIRETLPTLQYLLDRKARIIVASHLGRPKGKPDPTASLKPAVERLQELLPGVPIQQTQQPLGPDVETAVTNLAPSGILVLENMRFDAREEKNDTSMSQALAGLADVYVNDAFGAAHRAHASTEGVAHFVPIKVAGLLMQKELDNLGRILSQPGRPFTAIVGGSKVSTKIDVLNQLLQQVDNLVIGGGMIFTFLKAQGYPVGSSLVEDDYLNTAKALLEAARSQGKSIVLPQDIVVADQFSADAKHQVVPATAIPQGWMGLDIGPDAAQAIALVIQASKTVFWNGPLGVFEFPAFAAGTHAVAEAIVKATEKDGLMSVLGGGDTQAAIAQFNIPAERFTHVSTGGGATLELLEGKSLPGVTILMDSTASTSQTMAACTI